MSNSATNFGKLDELMMAPGSDESVAPNQPPVAAQICVEEPKFASLDGLRGLAVALVFTVHYTAAWTLLFPHAAVAGGTNRQVAEVAFSLGNSGVDLFMALSGYLIYDHMIRRPTRLSLYLARRSRRVFPTYLVVLAIYVVLMLIDPHKSKLIGDGWSASLYILECALLIPGLFGHNPIVGIAWSLSYEMAFYIFLPLLVVVTRLRRRTLETRVSVLLVAACLTIAFALSIGRHERFVMFIGGMLAREALVRCNYQIPYQGLFKVALGLALAGTVILMSLNRGPVDYEYPALPAALGRTLVLVVVFPGLIVACVGMAGLFRSVFEWKPLVMFGQISYSFYLIHNLVIRILIPQVAAHVPQSGASWFLGLAVIPTFLICLLSGLALHVAVERPLSLRKSRRPVAAAATSAPAEAVWQESRV
jgi:peptidoglycan/LPS O-acetylase OafA/YrhL